MTTKTGLGDDTIKNLTKKHPKRELPSFIDKNDSRGNKMGPLKDHTISKIRQQEDVSFLQDAAQIARIVSGEKTESTKPVSELDIDDMNKCMLEISYTRSIS